MKIKQILQETQKQEKCVPEHRHSTEVKNYFRFLQKRLSRTASVIKCSKLITMSINNDYYVRK